MAGVTIDGIHYETGAGPPQVSIPKGLMHNIPPDPVNLPVTVHMSGKPYAFGRISRESSTDAATQGTRFGTDSGARFNFLYNPNQISISTAANNTWDPESESAGITTAAPNGLQTFSFGLLLVRDVDSVNGKNNRPATSPEGTLRDLEILWRVLNGAPILRPSGVWSSDDGSLTSYPVDVWLGTTWSFKGYCSDLGINHVRFNANMIPVFTELSLTFSRIAGVAEQLKVANPTRTSSGDDSGTVAAGNSPDFHG